MKKVKIETDPALYLFALQVAHGGLASGKVTIKYPDMTERQMAQKIEAEITRVQHILQGA